MVPFIHFEVDVLKALNVAPLKLSAQPLGVHARI